MNRVYLLSQLRRGYRYPDEEAEPITRDEAKSRRGGGTKSPNGGPGEAAPKALK